MSTSVTLALARGGKTGIIKFLLKQFILFFLIHERDARAIGGRKKTAFKLTLNAVVGFYKKGGFSYRIAFTKFPMLSTPLLVKFVIKALPIIAPLAYCVAWSKVPLLLIPKPIT